ncbi:MAG: exonuclease domain-containing protein [Anaerolineae bacterium]
MNWWEGRLCTFDLETTGTDPEEARIVTACVALVGGGLSPKVEKWLVDPGIEIPAEASAVHGITTERARAEGVKPQGAVRDIEMCLREAAVHGCPIIIFNAPYDWTVLDREARRHSMGSRVLTLAETARTVDPLIIDRHLDKYRPGSRKLGDMCRHYGLKLEDAHDAVADCLAAARIAYRLGQKFARELSDLTQLMKKQTSWYRAWATNFAQYLERKGEQHDLDPEGWPNKMSRKPVVAPFFVP